MGKSPSRSLPVTETGGCVRQAPTGADITGRHGDKLKSTVRDQAAGQVPIYTDVVVEDLGKLPGAGNGPLRTKPLRLLVFSPRFDLHLVPFNKSLR